MSFPSSPTDGQTTTVNGITYVYVAAQGSWNRSAITANINVVTADYGLITGSVTATADYGSIV